MWYFSRFTGHELQSQYQYGGQSCPVICLLSCKVTAYQTSRYNVAHYPPQTDWSCTLPATMGQLFTSDIDFIVRSVILSLQEFDQDPGQFDTWCT